MSQQPNGIVNGPADYNTTIKDEIINKDMENLQNKEDGYVDLTQSSERVNPVPPLQRNESRSSFYLENVPNETGPHSQSQPHQNLYSPTQTRPNNLQRPLTRTDSRSYLKTEAIEDVGASELQPQQYPYPEPQPIRSVNPQRPLTRTESRSTFQTETVQDNRGQVIYQQYSDLPQQNRSVHPQKPLIRTDSRSSFQVETVPDETGYHNQLQPHQNSYSPKQTRQVNLEKPLIRTGSRSSLKMEAIEDVGASELQPQQYPYPQPQPIRSVNPQRPLTRTESRNAFQMETMQDNRGGQVIYQQYSDLPQQNRSVHPQRPLIRTDSRSSFHVTGVQQNGDPGSQISYVQSPQPYRQIHPQGRPLMRVDSRSSFQVPNTHQNESQPVYYQPFHPQPPQPPQLSGQVNPIRPLMRIDSRSTFQLPNAQNETGVHPQPPQFSQPGAPINPARPLTRIDSRSSFPFRPPFPNQPGTPLRPGQLRQPQPSGVQQQFVQRNPTPGLAQRPPISPGAPTQPFPQNQQNRPTLRPQASFQRPPVQNQAPLGLQHQRSVPAFNLPRPQIQEEGLSRSQTLETAEIEYSKSPDDNKNTTNDHIKVSSTAAMNNRSYSLNMNQSDSSNDAIDEQRRRSASNVYGLREGRPSSEQSSVSGSTESLDKKQDNEVPSRPESRAASRMDKIVENDDRHRSSLTEVSPKSPDMSSDSTGEKSLPTLSDTNDTTNSNKPKPEQTENVKSHSQNPKSPSPKTKSHSPQPPSPKPSSQSSRHQTIKLEKSRHEDAEHQNAKPIVDQSEGPKKPTRLLNLEKPPKAKSPARSEGDNDSGVDESTQGNDPLSNGENRSPRKVSKSRTSSTTPTARSLSRGSKSPSLKSPDSNVTTPGSATEKKKIPMNKIQVGSAPSPNLKVVRSKIGSLDNASHKPGGGKVKIETKKLDFKAAAPRIEAKNDKYMPKGGEKKIVQQKLQWNAKSKIGSLENATYKPKGGEKKIESMKLDFKEKAKPKVGSKDNIKHQPGGGDIKSEEIVDEKENATENMKPSNIIKKIENRKIDVKVNSKVGSLDNMKHKPGGGDKKIFDDKDYLKQKSAVPSIDHSLSGSQNSLPPQQDTKVPVADENLNQEH